MLPTMPVASKFGPVALLFLAIPCLAQDKPPVSDCIVLKSSANVTNYDSKISSETVTSFVDNNTMKGIAVFRRYDNMSEKRTADIFLTLADNDRWLCTVDRDLVEPEPLQAVHLRPGQDSLFLVGHKRMATGAGEEIYWLLLLNPRTSQWSGFLLDTHQWAEFMWPVISDGFNLRGTEMKPEDAYLTKRAYDYGYFDQEFVEHHRNDPQWSAKVWLIDNPDLLSGQPHGNLKLQWYPWDERLCTQHDAIGAFDSLKIVDAANLVQNDFPQDVAACDLKQRRWALLFLATGYKEGNLEGKSSELQKSSLTVTTRSRRIAINLRDFSWVQQGI